MSNSAKITWTDSVTSGVTHSKIYRDDVLIGTVELGVEIFYDATILTGITYKYEVQASGPDGETTEEVQDVNVTTVTISDESI